MEDIIAARFFKVGTLNEWWSKLVRMDTLPAKGHSMMFFLETSGRDQLEAHRDVQASAGKKWTGLGSVSIC